MAQQSLRLVKNASDNFTSRSKMYFDSYDSRGWVDSEIVVTSIRLPYEFKPNGGGYYRSSGAYLQFKQADFEVDWYWSSQGSSWMDKPDFLIEFTLYGHTFSIDTSQPYASYTLNVPWDTLEQNDVYTVNARVKWLSGVSQYREWVNTTFNFLARPNVLNLTYQDTVTVPSSQSFTYEYWGHPFSYSYVRLRSSVNGVAVQTFMYLNDQSGSVAFSPTAALYAQFFPTSYQNCEVDFELSELDSRNTVINSQTFTVKLTFSESDLSPTVSATVTEGNTQKPSAFGSNYVSGVSAYKVTPSVTAKYGATIESIAVLAVGNTYEAQNGYPVTTDILQKRTDSTVIVVVTDSRGLSKSQGYGFSVLEWFPPTVTSISIHRGRYSGGVWTPDDTGNYCKIEWAVKFAPVNNLNKKYLKISAPDGNHVITLSSYVQSGVLYSAADTESSFDIVLTLTDYVTTFVRTVTLSTAGVVLDIKAGGKGVGLGKVAEYEECVEVNPQWGFRVYGMTLEEYIQQVVGNMNS